MFAHFAARRNTTHAVNITHKVNITCPQGQTSFKKAYHSRDRLFCGWEIGVFACSEDTRTLRLVSELTDLRVGYANPAPTALWFGILYSSDKGKKNRPSDDGLFFFGRGIGIRTPTYRVRVCCAAVTQFPFIERTIF